MSYNDDIQQNNIELAEILDAVNSLSGGDASITNATVRSVEVKEGEFVEAGEFVQIRREGATVPTFDDVLTFSVAKAAICALTETKIVAFHAATESSMYNVYATVIEKLNGAWTEGTPTLIKSVAKDSYATYVPIVAVKVSDSIVILDTSQKGSGNDYKHEVVAVSVDAYNVITAGQPKAISTGSSSRYWVVLDGVLEYAGEYNALFHCAISNSTSIAATTRSGHGLVGITVDPASLALTVGTVYRFIAEVSSDVANICPYANAIHISDNKLLVAAAYKDGNEIRFEMRVAIVAVNAGTVAILSTKTLTGATTSNTALSDTDMPCLFKIDNSNFMMLQNKFCWKIVLSDDTISTLTAITNASVAPTLTKHPTLKKQVDETTTLYLWNSSSYMRAQLFHVVDIDTPVDADDYVTVTDTDGNATGNVALATSIGQKILFLTDNLYLNEADAVTTDYAYPYFDRIDGLAKTAGSGGDTIEVYVPEVV